MTEPLKFEDVLAARKAPTVGIWNRLEGRPRTIGFDRALRAEIRDPLWMFTRQWQLGEFLGTDGGSPVTATYAVAAAKPSRFRPDGGAPIPLPTTSRWNRSPNGGRCRSLSAPTRSPSTSGWPSGTGGSS
jgi:hypothetical protein